MSVITRARGVTLSLLDVSAHQDIVLDALNSKIPSDSTARYVEAKCDSIGVAYGNDGILYAVCSEGVGWEVSANTPLTIDFRASWTDYDGGPRNFSITASSSAEFTLSEVLAMASEDEVDLADFVRSFGARLESNFLIWHRLLSK